MMHDQSARARITAGYPVASTGRNSPFGRRLGNDVRRRRWWPGSHHPGFAGRRAATARFPSTPHHYFPEFERSTRRKVGSTEPPP